MKRKTKKILTTLAVIFAVLAICASSVLAYYLISGAIKNTFQPAIPDRPAFGAGKIEVATQGYPVYVRTAIVVTWQKPSQTDGDGAGTNQSVHYTQPVRGTDYKLELNDGWVLGDDGFYYYGEDKNGELGLTLVASDKRFIDSPIKNCNRLDTNGPDGYTLSVEVIVETVQAIGRTDDDLWEAWQDAWGNVHPMW